MRTSVKTQKELERVVAMEALDSKTPEADSNKKSLLTCDYAFSGQGKSKDSPINGGGYLFGEDAVWVKTFIGEDFQLTVMMILDGHGQNGEKASSSVLRLFRQKIITPEFFELCRQMNPSKEFDVKNHLIEMFKMVEKEYFLPTGGTTVSLALVISSSEDRHYLITANVGDSPIVFLPPDDQRTFLAFQSHSWDEIEERKKYLSYCKQNRLQPREVILGRFNTLSGTPLPREDGTIRPWFIFKKGTAEIDEAVMEEFQRVIKNKHRDCIGGVQSIRKMIMEQLIVMDRKVSIIPDYPLPGYNHLNWGSTGFDGFIGRTQMTRSIGDLEAKTDLHMRADPDIFIRELILGEQEETTFQLVMCSDGVGDLFYFHEFREFLDASKPTNDQIQDLFVHLWRKTKRSSRFCLDPKTNRPTWDDCSVILCNIYLNSIF